MGFGHDKFWKYCVCYVLLACLNQTLLLHLFLNVGLESIVLCCFHNISALNVTLGLENMIGLWFLYHFDTKRYYYIGFLHFGFGKSYFAYVFFYNILIYFKPRGYFLKPLSIFVDCESWHATALRVRLHVKTRSAAASQSSQCGCKSRFSVRLHVNTLSAAARR